MESRLWSFDDIKDATMRYYGCRDSDNPVRHYFYGVALEMSGQVEDADEKYAVFRLETLQKFGNLSNGADYYGGQAEALRTGGDEQSAEHYVNMARILRGPEPGIPASKSCVVV